MGKGTQAATIYDVAYKAGVSISTVSRVLNQHSKVHSETRKKVLGAVAQLNYKADVIARGLVMKKVDRIEVCFCWSSRQIDLENPWYVGLLNGIHQVAQDEKVGLLINTISGVFDAKEVQQRVTRNAVDGVLLVSPYLREPEWRHLKHFSVPLVLVGCRIEDPGVDWVSSENTQAVDQVVDHLAGKGHLRIACITGEVEISRDADDRWKGFQRAMKRRDLKVAPELVVGGDFGRGSGEEAMKKLLALKKRPTAVFVCNDAMALGAWDVATESGLKVGRDLALVGFDDIPQASAPPYSLSTVRQDYRAMSTEAAKMLIEKTRHREGWKTRHVIQPTHLVGRSSSAFQLTNK